MDLKSLKKKFINPKKPFELQFKDGYLIGSQKNNTISIMNVPELPEWVKKDLERIKNKDG